MDRVWSGATTEEDAYHQFEVADCGYEEDYEFFEAPLRWNKNIKEDRERVCWVCGHKTNDYFVHKWRTPDGKVDNIKCTECFNEYKGIGNNGK